MKTNIIAMYLPQFHQIPENDEFWGKGFTDWVTVKRALPLFEGHIQPKVPLDENYYDLSIKENIEWQARLAEEYGIFGFGIYHYWFNNEKNLLTKPAEIILENKDINIRFFFSWDNTLWKRSWSNVKGGNAWAPSFEKLNSGPEILIPYIIGEKPDWEYHYSYLLPFFKDSRYIKIDNKPVFTILHYSSKIAKMCDFWNELAIKDGFNGIHFIFRYDKRENIPLGQNLFKYEPIYSGWTPKSFVDRVINKIRLKLHLGKHPRQLNYDDIWEEILSNSKKMDDPHIIHGAFVSYDDSPRRGKRGIVVRDSNPQKFKFFMKQLVNISKEQNKEFIFLTAWNEWGEGAYLEPDVFNQYAYLEVIKELQNTAI